jgi:hypothetical protein
MIFGGCESHPLIEHVLALLSAALVNTSFVGGGGTMIFIYYYTNKKNL